MTHQTDRRKFFRRLAGATGTLLLTGCDKLSDSEWFGHVLSTGESLNKGAHHLLRTRKAMAQEFSEADLSPDFRSNGTSFPESAEYQTMAKADFKDWSLEIAGLVATPLKLTMAQIQALPSRTQITRHDCVEGWSAIAKWKGTPLHEIFALVNPLPNARYVVFYCADPMEDDGTDLYYESIDMEDAYHKQTILAYELNGTTLPIKNGAPIRLRVERQLGYKQAKYIMKIALVAQFDDIAGGKGGYWEDNGCEWYAGI
ncbi:MAG: molybdopterin-dependent oxidoreductase [Bdellovibrio sp.]|nr:molybdopterin-dependent oxidoreductase [Methylotenera sp.]